MSYRRPLGTSLTSTVLISAGANAIVPGSGPIVATGATLLGNLFGGGKRDAQRQARCDWFTQAAKQGSVLAGRVLIGGTQNTAGHESPMYQKAIEGLLNNPQWAPTMHAALEQGPYWRTDDNDSADKMRGQVENELLAAQSTPAPSSSSSSSSARRRTSQLPAMTTTAEYNYLPLLIAGGAAAFLFFRPRRGSWRS